MKNITTIERRFLKKVLNIMGVGSIGLMVSCTKYGAEISTINMHLNGIVKSKDSTKVIEGIQVEVRNSISNSNVLTSNNGAFSINSEIGEYENTVNLRILDIDGDLNGSFQLKDTSLTLSSEEKQAQIKQNIDIKLDRNE